MVRPSVTLGISLVIYFHCFVLESAVVSLRPKLLRSEEFSESIELTTEGLTCKNLFHFPIKYCGHPSSYFKQRKVDLCMIYKIVGFMNEDYITIALLKTVFESIHSIIKMRRYFRWTQGRSTWIN